MFKILKSTNQKGNLVNLYKCQQQLVSQLYSINLKSNKILFFTNFDTLQADLDEMASEAAMSEDKAQRAMIDAARLAEELRQEQETAQILEHDRKLMEAQAKDMQV